MFGLGKKIDYLTGKVESFLNNISEVESKLREEIKSLKDKINDKTSEKELYKKFDSLETEVIMSKVKVEERLVQFHKEITDKYFATLQDIFRVNKEISLIDNLAKAIDDKEMAKLKSSLMQPFLEARWKEKEGQKSVQVEENIKSKGKELLNMQKDLHEKYLILNRQKQDTTAIEAQLKILETIIGGDSNEVKA